MVDHPVVSLEEGNTSATLLTGINEKLTTIRPAQAWFYLLVLLVINLLREADTWALATLQASGLQCESCGTPDTNDFYNSCRKHCLDITDVQMGFLVGPAFTLTNLLASFPLGWLADTHSRKWIIFAGLVAWSTATLVSGFVQNFWQLALARLLMALGAATINPTAYSLLSDYFPKSQRAFVLACFSSAIYTGQILGLVSGFISQNYTWRIAFFALGAPGLVVAVILVFTVKEPVRGMSEIIEDMAVPESHTGEKSGTESVSEQKSEAAYLSQLPFWRKILFLVHLPSFMALCVAAAIRNLGGYALGGWLQVFLVRSHGLQASDFLIWLIFVIPIGGAGGAAVGGRIADYLSRNSLAGKPALLAISCFLATPFITWFLISESAIGSLILLLPSYFFAEFWWGTSASLVQDLIPPVLRGLATAMYFIILSLGALSPVIVGALNSDKQISPVTTEDGADPRNSMLIMVPGTYALGGFGFLALMILIVFHSEQKEKLCLFTKLLLFICEKKCSEFYKDQLFGEVDNTNEKLFGDQEESNKQEENDKE